MGYLLSVAEVLEFAVFIEQSGYAFYIESLKKFPERKIVEFFQYLADEEFKHETLFKKMQAEADSFTPPESYDGEYQRYLREFCKTHSLANRDVVLKKLAKVSSFADALAMALDFERDSVVFFTELKGVVGKDRSGAVEQIIHEEMNHIRRIIEFRDAARI